MSLVNILVAILVIFLVFVLVGALGLPQWIAIVAAILVVIGLLGRGSGRL